MKTDITSLHQRGMNEKKNHKTSSLQQMNAWLIQQVKALSKLGGGGSGVIIMSAPGRSLPVVDCVAGSW